MPSNAPCSSAPDRSYAPRRIAGCRRTRPRSRRSGPRPPRSSAALARCMGRLADHAGRGFDSPRRRNRRRSSRPRLCAPAWPRGRSLGGFRAALFRDEKPALRVHRRGVRGGGRDSRVLQPLDASLLWVTRRHRRGRPLFGRDPLGPNHRAAHRGNAVHDPRAPDTTRVRVTPTEFVLDAAP